jgi:hypothetical protein
MLLSVTPQTDSQDQTIHSLRLPEMFAVKLVDNFSCSLHDFHSPRRIGMTTQRDLVAADRKLNFLARNRGNSRILHLTLNVLPRLIWMPRPVYGKDCDTKV